MIEQYAIEQRGREMGLRPRGSAVSVVDVRRAWVHVPASRIRPGDVWAYRGLVDSVDSDEEGLVVYVGIPPEPVRIDPESVVYLFAPIHDVTRSL